MDPTPLRRPYPLLAVCLLALTGCATTPGEPLQPQPTPDPLEAVNRGVFEFNLLADKVLLRPVARGYRAITPPVVRTGITNFFDTVSIPRILVNDLLQGKFKAAGQDIARLLVNATVGLGGLIDIASREGIPKNNEDFGQTLAVWGVPSGPYLMVPLLGAYTMRGAFGEVGDWPLRTIPRIDDSSVRTPLEVLYIVSRRSQLLSTDSLMKAALDPYVFVREAYLQRRTFLIYDGDPPVSDDLEDGFLDEEFSEEDFLGGD